MPYYLGYAATPDARILWREISAGEYEHIWACLPRIIDPQTGWVDLRSEPPIAREDIVGIMMGAPGHKDATYPTNEHDLALEFLVYDTFREKGNEPA